MRLLKLFDMPVEDIVSLKVGEEWMLIVQGSIRIADNQVKAQDEGSTTMSLEPVVIFDQGHDGWLGEVRVLLSSINGVGGVVRRE